MIEANKYKLGIFVLTGIVLLIVTMFLLGLSEALKPKINFITYFNESVQGLDIGSPVKFRGVTIGKVTRIAIRPKDNFIRVDMQAIPSSIQPSEHGTKPIDFFNNLPLQVKKGLTCRLELAGITGMKYVEMDYLKKDEKFKMLPLIPPKNSQYIPSTPSLMSGLRTSLSVALTRIASIDFKKLSSDVSSTLFEAKRILADPKIKNMITKTEKLVTNMESMSRNFKESMTKQRIKEITKEFHETIKSINNLSKRADTHLKDSKIPDTTKAIRELRSELSETLIKLDSTLDAFSELAKAIEEDPSSIIRGKQPSNDY